MSFEISIFAVQFNSTYFGFLAQSPVHSTTLGVILMSPVSLQSNSNADFPLKLFLVMSIALWR